MVVNSFKVESRVLLAFFRFDVDAISRIFVFHPEQKRGIVVDAGFPINRLIPHQTEGSRQHSEFPGFHVELGLDLTPGLKGLDRRVYDIVSILHVESITIGLRVLDGLTLAVATCNISRVQL